MEFEGLDKITSENKIPVVMVITQVSKNRKIEGKKPALAVITGRANIPAPIEVPTMIETAATNFKSKILIRIIFCIKGLCINQQKKTISAKKIEKLLKGLCKHDFFSWIEFFFRHTRLDKYFLWCLKKKESTMKNWLVLFIGLILVSALHSKTFELRTDKLSQVVEYDIPRKCAACGHCHIPGTPCIKN